MTGPPLNPPGASHNTPGPHCQKHTHSFECRLFHAGARPPAYLSSKDIFCGQLGDETQREKNGNKVKRGGGVNRHQACFQSAFFETLWWRLLVCSSPPVIFGPAGRSGMILVTPRGRSARAPAFPKSVTCVEHLRPNPPMIHFTNLDDMGLSDPRTALEGLEIVIKGR